MFYSLVEISQMVWEARVMGFITGIVATVFFILLRGFFEKQK